ncbi:toxin CrTX-A-like [Pecten maximus]|uniref:toxin CrTX-A-like n=1 Tax=Pecten maximus TaxID=6579 RepID=UPI001458A6C3|nr:toxin CrTX-A-like [Pecten maximus]
MEHLKTASPTIDDVEDVLSKIEVYLQQMKINLNRTHEVEKTYFKNGDGPIHIQRLQEVANHLKTIYRHLPQFTSGDPFQVLHGVAGIVSSVSSFTGLGGPAVPAICGVLSKVFTAFGGTKITIAEVVENEIRRTFSGHSNETLLEEAEDLHLMYRFAFDFLNPASEKSNFTEHDITNMNIQMNVFQGVTFLRKLGKLIKELAKEHEDTHPNKKIEKAKKAMDFIELYIKLALLRDMLLLHFYAIINSTTHSHYLAGGVQRVLGSFDEQDRAALGLFLKPTKEYVYIVSYVKEEECELLLKFLDQKKLTPDHSWLAHGEFELYSQKWPTYHATRMTAHRSFFGNGDLRFIRGTYDSVGPESLFCFKQIEEKRNCFYITQGRKLDELICMTKGPNRWVMSLKDGPKHQCEWKVIQMDNGNYVFSPRVFPDYFMGMTKLLDGSVAGFLGGYNEQSHWTLRASD